MNTSGVLIQQFGPELAARQIELEREGSTLVSANFLKELERAMEEGDVNGVQAYSWIFRAGVPLVAKAIDSWKAEASSPKGRRKATLLKFIETMKSKVVAYIALTTFLGKPLTNTAVARKIGVDLDTQMRLDRLESEYGRVYEGAIREGLKQRHGDHGKPSIVFADLKLKHMAVDPKQFKEALSHVKASSKLDKLGRLSFDAGRFLQGSPQVVSEIRRMGDIAATDMIQRPSLRDTFIWADSGKASLIAFLTQFQTFSMRSLEKKFMRGANRIKNGDMDEALQVALSVGLSGLGVAAFAAIRGQAIRDEEKSAQFYKNAMGYDSDSGEWDLGTLAIGALKRSSYMAGPSLAYDTVGPPLGLPHAGMGRTTRDVELDAEETPRAWRGIDPGNTVANFPAIKYATQTYGAATNLANLLRSDLDEEQVERQKVNLLRNLKGILPNDPATQSALGWFMEHGTYEQ